MTLRFAPVSLGRIFKSILPRRLALTVVLIFSPLAAYALDAGRSLTQALHRIWQVPQGLPQATIYSIRQTQDGYLWLGTQSGLVRFDGVRFTSIGESSGLSWPKI